MKQFENGHIYFYFLLLWNGEHRWFRAVLRLTDSLFIIIIIIIIFIFLWEVEIEWEVIDSW